MSEQLTVGRQTVWLSTQDKAGCPNEDGWRHLVLFDGNGPRWVYEVAGVRVTRQLGHGLWAEHGGGAVHHREP